VVSYWLHSERAIPSQVTCGGTVAVDTTARFRSRVRAPFDVTRDACFLMIILEFIVASNSQRFTLNAEMAFRDRDVTASSALD